MGEQQPEAKHRLGENVQHRIGNNLSINVNLT